MKNIFAKETDLSFLSATMDPNQTVGTMPSGIDNIDPTGSNSRTDTLPVGPTGADGTTGTTHTQQNPPIGTLNQEQSSVHYRSSPPDRTGARVWNHPGERQAADYLIRSQSSRPISPTPLAQTREEVIELREMVSSLIDEARN